MADSTISPIKPTITAATSTAAAAANGAANSTGIDKTTLAGNFQTFLTLLTAQLKNQNPLDPLDTNQFTQQLVSFAQVEQQLKQNDQLATLVSLERSAQATTALAYVGQMVAVNGQTAALSNARATWTFNAPKPVTATVTIISETGQTAYSGTFTMNAGQQDFQWDGRGINGVQWPDGNYTLTITAKDAGGQAVSVPTEIQGVIDFVDLTQSPPMLSIGGQSFTFDKIKRVVRPGA